MLYVIVTQVTNYDRSKYWSQGGHICHSHMSHNHMILRRI